MIFGRVGTYFCVLGSKTQRTGSRTLCGLRRARFKRKRVQTVDVASSAFEVCCVAVTTPECSRLETSRSSDSMSNSTGNSEREMVESRGTAPPPQWQLLLAVGEAEPCASANAASPLSSGCDRPASSAAHATAAGDVGCLSDGNCAPHTDGRAHTRRRSHSCQGHSRGVSGSRSFGPLMSPAHTHCGAGSTGGRHAHASSVGGAPPVLEARLSTTEEGSSPGAATTVGTPTTTQGAGTGSLRTRRSDHPNDDATSSTRRLVEGEGEGAADPGASPHPRHGGSPAALLPVLLDAAAKRRLSGPSIPTPEELLAHSASALDVPSPKDARAPRTQTRAAAAWWWERIDQEASIAIHNTDPGPLAEAALLLPATLFQPFSVPLLLVFFLIWSPPSLFCELALGTILTLLTTNLMKAHIGRLRPGPYTLVKRRVNLRSLEKNHAMPSGDSAQAAMWALTAARYCGTPAPLLVVPATMLGRVFFGCHWIGDTVVGTVVGALWAAAVTTMRSQACASEAATLLGALGLQSSLICRSR